MLSGCVDRIHLFLSSGIAALVLLVIVGGYIVLGTRTTNDDRVLDCSEGRETCYYRSLEAIEKDCKNWGGKGCETTTLGVEEVSFISFVNNYIDEPFTEERFSVFLVNDRLRVPWDLEFLPDGQMLVTQKTGQLVRIEHGEERTILLVDVISLGEVGLLGLAIDPQFETNRYAYIYYTYSFDDSDQSYASETTNRRRVFNKIERLTLAGDTVAARHTILDRIPGSLVHSGGRLEFGPDGRLFATTGDGSTSYEPQDPSSLLGKVLRLNPDGTVPPDNPYPGSFVYSMGHRNPQGLAWDPVTNTPYTSEHGPWRFDEINRIIPGRNYGWGSFQCDESRGDPVVSESLPPLICFKRWTMAPSGMEFVADRQSKWFGNLFVAGLRGGHVHRYVFDGDDIVISEVFFISAGKDYIPKEVEKARMDLRIRDVEYRDGSLYFLGDHYGLVRVEPR